MEKNNIETQKEKPYFYACCPMCKRMLLQSANGADCYIKCVQCDSKRQNGIGVRSSGCDKKMLSKSGL